MDASNLSTHVLKPFSCVSILFLLPRNLERYLLLPLSALSCSNYFMDASNLSTHVLQPFSCVSILFLLPRNLERYLLLPLSALSCSMLSPCTETSITLYTSAVLLRFINALAPFYYYSAKSIYTCKNIW